MSTETDKSGQKETEKQTENKTVKGKKAPGRKKRGIREQLLAVFTLGVIIPMLILSAYTVRTLIKSLQEHYETQVDAETTRVKSLLFDITSSMYTSSEPIISVQAYRDLFGENYYLSSDREKYDSLSRALASLHESTAAISTIGIYTNNPVIPGNSVIHNAGGKLTSYEWYQKLGSDTWNMWTCTHSEREQSQSQYELTLVRRINTGTYGKEAFLVITISMNYLRNRLLVGDSVIYASVGDEPCFFASELEKVDTEMPFEFEPGEVYSFLGDMDLEGEKVKAGITSFSSYKVPDRFYVLTANPWAQSRITALRRVLMLVMILAVVVPLIIITAFSTKFAKRVGKLRSAMHRASEGDYDIIENFAGNDELTDTFEDLKTMTEQIREREKTYYEAEIREQQLENAQQKMEFKMLSSQINPHFLYNTLETIRMQAILGGNKNVSTSIKLLSKIMHYVLENTERTTTTLAKELEHVSNYLQIQQLRFGERVNWNFYISEDVDPEHFPMLPLLIQPVVENAVTHGLEKVNEKGYVNIAVERTKENTVLITVVDNGGGIGKEKLETLIKGLEDRSMFNDRASIGLYNINQRIRLNYGQEYGLTIKSEEGLGTSVIMTLPSSVPTGAR